MKEIKGKTEGNIKIKENTVLRGMIVGDVKVLESAEFIISGMIIGNVTVHENTKVYIRGTVNGDVINKGGYLEVYGIVKGRLLKERGTEFVDKDAIIKQYL